MITIEHDHANFLVCRVSGKLTKADYDAMVPELDNALQMRSGERRMMIVLEDFRGWDLRALWEELKFDVRHWNDFARIAVVGQSRLEEWGTRLSRPLSGAKMRYYEMQERDMAGAWLSERKAAGAGPANRNAPTDTA